MVESVWLGMLCALFAAICYGVASTMQAVAAMGTRDDRQGVDPRLLFRLLGQWRYLVGVALDVVGLAAQIWALRTLPLFLVQASMAASIVVTALLATRLFRIKLSGIEWAAVIVVCAGLAMLGAAADSEGAGHGTHKFHYGLLIAVVVLALLGVAAGRLPDPARTAGLGLVSGLGFGAMGTSIRVLPGLSWSTLIIDPATYAAAGAGVLAGWFYASALQRGGVVAATAMMLIGETVPPALIGVFVLGDHTRHGWTTVAIIGFAIALACAVALARFGEVKPTQRSAAAAEVSGG
jgi:drug/metabolite transporter (DMT)-like permease